MDKNGSEHIEEQDASANIQAAENPIISFLSSRMQINKIGTGINGFRVTGRIYEPLKAALESIKEYFRKTEYTPLFSVANGEHNVHLAYLRKAEDRPEYWLNILLFAATLLSTMFVGAYNAGADPIKNIADMVCGIPFSFSIMAILTCHEFGHYIVSRRAGMITSLPYFIPVPINLIGTLGAIIRMKSIIPSRRDLLNVGMAGPICGFLISLPITVIGIALSDVQPTTGTVAAIRLGDSLLFSFFVRLLHANMPPGHDLFLHPMAFAGWIGFLVTSLNLLPIGQLDGGHIAFSIFGRNRKRSYPFLIAAMIGLSLLWPGWIIWGLLAFLTARREPVVQDTITPITRKDRILALVPLLVLILTFIPQPFTIF